MSRSLIQSVAVGVNLLSPGDDEDNDICPVCDGDCTCNNKSPPSPSPAHGSARFVVTPVHASGSSSNIPVVQPLKIKLSVPPSIQNKVRSLGSAHRKSRPDASSVTSSGAAASSSTSPYPSYVSSTVGHGHSNLSDAGMKRRGRPPKGVISARDKTTRAVSNRLIYGNEATTLPQSQSHLQSHHSLAHRSTSRPQVKSSRQPKSNLVASRQIPKSQARGAPAKKAGSSKKTKRTLFNDDTDSDLDLDNHDVHALDDDEDDTSSGRFPTFVSADALTSEASDSSESDLDSDSSGFGSDSSLAAEEESYILAEQRRQDKARIRRELLGDEVPKHKDSNNTWVIRPRKRSVGLSDVDMDGDTDDITEDGEEEEDEMEDEEEEEDATDGQPSQVYTGLATGWSDDEESSFDADIFFANLTDTSDDNSSDEDNSPFQDIDADADHLSNSVSSLKSVDFEVTEAWDGQIVFTNGSADGHGALDLAFEANAAQLIASDSASISHGSDVEMHSTIDTDGDEDHNSELGESDGETTEEELVDERGLPTSRAMKLFRWPTSVSSINPMSTVSPNVSPAPLSRRYPPSSMLESPRPADILAGKSFWEESDQSRPDSPEGSAVSSSPRVICRRGAPLMGQFNLDNAISQKTAVLTGENKAIPSPYHRLGHRRRFSSSGGSFSSMDFRGRVRSSSLHTSFSSLPPPSDEPSSEMTPEITLGEPIELDDVLDSTFLDSEPESQMQCVPDSEDEQRHLQSLNRWDRVPVGAFRLTRESAASTSDIPTSPGWSSEPTALPEARSYGSALKNSPLHTMLWHDKGVVRETPRKSKAVIISPVLLPVCDGDLTPTHVPHHHDLHSNHQQYTPYKNRKESRREMKMLKRKTHGPLHQQHDYHHQRHHRRNHHPNMKSRGNASVQRTFLSSPTSSQR